MPLLIPPSVNYGSPLVAVPSFMQDQPKEGRMQVPCEILWGVGAPLIAAKCVFINLQNNAALNISQISTIKVDNSASGADVVFIFPDTSDTVTVPAGTPMAVVPVFSNATQLYINAPQALAGDVTRFQLLNYQTYPADVPATTAAQTASSGANVVPATGLVQLIPATISGTLEVLQLNLCPPTTAVQMVVSVRDGAGVPKVLVNSWNIAVPAAVSQTWIPMIDFDDMNWRFTNGLQITFAAGGGAGNFLANGFASYRQP